MRGVVIREKAQHRDVKKINVYIIAKARPNQDDNISSKP